MSGEKSDSVSMDVKDIREYLFIFYIFPSSKSVHDLSLKLEEMKKSCIIFFLVQIQIRGKKYIHWKLIKLSRFCSLFPYVDSISESN